MAMLLLMVVAMVSACAGPPRPGTRLERRGDEIVIAGQLFHTGTPVVLWTDPGGYDAYRVEKRFAPYEESSWEAMQKAGKGPETPNRYGLRFAKALNAEEIERIRGGGYTLAEVQERVDQFVIHYDVCGTSRTCFRVLHDLRGLSVHFMLDIDGTIYQTLDVKERAWHATTSNDRSVGIEIANIGAYPPGKAEVLREWYGGALRCAPEDPCARPTGQIITIPSRLGDGGLRVPGLYWSIRDGPVAGTIQGQELVMYDLTPPQYAALEKLTATLCLALPRIRCEFPRDAEGRLITDKLPDDQLAAYRGLLGHYHIQKDKVDPGPAFQWERVVGNARRMMGGRERREP